MSDSAFQDLILIQSAAFLRSFCTGLFGVLLGIHLYRGGISAFGIGIVLTAGLAGAALATLLVSIRGDSFGRRRTLAILSAFTALGGISLALHPSLSVLSLLAFFGMLNGTGTDRSAAYAFEQAAIPSLVPDRSRTWALSWYNVAVDAGGAVGGLAAGLPLLFARWSGETPAASYRKIFLICAALSMCGVALYLALSDRVEHRRSSSREAERPALSPATRGILVRLCGLFSLDAFGGGFLTDALVAFWFFRRFGVSEVSLGFLFFSVRVLNALSHLGAAWLARRIGLVNTMVFTHLPSSLFLMAVPFAPSLRVAILLFLCREALVEMDVPTRQSYVAAIVRPEERSFASGVTNVARNVFWALGSLTAGMFMQGVALSSPLLFGAGAKIAYDFLLFRSFRRLKPPEERSAAS
jgi:predicted MFS family arabinose efflux permease